MIKKEGIDMKVAFHHHAVVTIETNDGTKIIIDPFIRGNEKCDLEVDQLDVDVILLTHAHSDHFGDTIELAQKNEALVISNVEISAYLSQFNIETHGMQPGGSSNLDFGKISFTPAIHGSSLEINGKPHTLGLACGIILEADGKTIYHMGDTALYSDMKLIGDRFEIDLAFIPIGDTYTMGIRDALQASKWIKAKKIVPIHYNTFPEIEQNPQEFTDQLEEAVGIIPSIGEFIDF